MGPILEAAAASRFTMPFPNAFRRYEEALTLELWVQLRGTGPACLQPSVPLAKLLWVEGVEGAAWGLAVTGDRTDALLFELNLDADDYRRVDAVTVDGVLQRASDESCSNAPWHHVVATFEVGAPTANMKIYVDGQLTPENAEQHPRSLGARPEETVIAGFELEPRLDVGGSGRVVDLDESTLGEPVDGSLDELAVYSRALTASEVAAHHAAALP